MYIFFHLNYSLLNVRLDIVRFFNIDLFWDLPLNNPVDFNIGNLRFLAFTMLRIVNRFLNHYFHNFWNLMLFNNCFLYFDKLDFFLHYNMMHRLFNHFKWRLFIYSRYKLLNLHNLINLSIHIHGDFFFNNYLFYLYISCMIWDLELFLNLLNS